MPLWKEDPDHSFFNEMVKGALRIAISDLPDELQTTIELYQSDRHSAGSKKWGEDGYQHRVTAALSALWTRLHDVPVIQEAIALGVIGGELLKMNAAVTGKAKPQQQELEMLGMGFILGQHPHEFPVLRATLVKGMDSSVIAQMLNVDEAKIYGIVALELVNFEERWSRELEWMKGRFRELLLDFDFDWISSRLQEEWDPERISQLRTTVWGISTYFRQLDRVVDYTVLTGALLRRCSRRSNEFKILDLAVHSHLIWLIKCLSEENGHSAIDVYHRIDDAILRFDPVEAVV